MYADARQDPHRRVRIRRLPILAMTIAASVAGIVTAMPFACVVTALIVSAVKAVRTTLAGLGQVTINLPFNQTFRLDVVEQLGLRTLVTQISQIDDGMRVYGLFIFVAVVMLFMIGAALFGFTTIAIVNLINLVTGGFVIDVEIVEPHR